METEDSSLGLRIEESLSDKDGKSHAYLIWLRETMECQDDAMRPTDSNAKSDEGS